MTDSANYGTTEAISLEDILSDTNTRLMVPASQRNYSWKHDDHVKKLWSDLIANFTDWRVEFPDRPTLEAYHKAEFLIGPMVFVKNPNSQDDELEIFDGQQRLATLTILLCIVRDTIIELEEDRLSKQDAKLADVSELLNIIKATEIYVKDPSTQKIRHIDWRLTMNNMDKEFFEEIVLPYEPEQDDPFVSGTLPYKRISMKIQHCKKKLQEHTKDKIFVGKESEEKLHRAYIQLKKYVDTALLTNFEIDEAIVKEKNDQIETTCGEKIDKELRSPITHSSNTANSYGINPDEFFNDPKEGLDTLTKRSWTPEVRKDLEEEHKARSVKWKVKKTFDQWIEEKIKKMKNKKCSTIWTEKKYAEIRQEHIDTEIEEQTKQARKLNITHLQTFCFDQLLKYLFSVRVKVIDYEIANVVFERLNDRGEPLSKSNLVKNYIVSLFPIEKRQKMGAEWDGIMKQTTNPDGFLLESLISRGVKGEFYKYDIGEPKTVKGDERNLYRIIKFIVNNGPGTLEENADAYIKNLKMDIAYCKMLDNPTEEISDPTDAQVTQNRAIKPALIDLDALGAVYIRLPILTALRKWTTTTREAITTDEFILLTKFLVSFFFRYKTVRNADVSVLEKWILNTCKYVHEEEFSINVVIKIIKVLLQEDKPKNFESQLRERFGEPSTPIANFVLEHITKELGNNDTDIRVSPRLQVEHILPQSAKEWDETDFLDDYIQYNKDTNVEGFDETLLGLPPKFDNFKDKLGNLTLLSAPKNKKLSRKPFTEKLNAPSPNGYVHSPLEINKQTVVKVEDTDVDRADWTSLSILNREEYLMGLIVKLWELPQICCTKHDCTDRYKPIRVNNVDYHASTDGKIKDVDDVKCDSCQKDLNIIWPTGNAEEYRAPTAYQNP